MRLRNLGRTGLQLSPTALGTMNFGPATNAPDAHRIMSAALDAGVNLFDTANVYCADANRLVADYSPNKGATESIIGNWFADNPSRRGQTVLISKAYGRMGPGPNDQHLSARHLHQACEDSLRRLRTDVIDIFMLHHIDRATSWDEIWETLDDLCQAGKIRYCGTSNFAGWHLVQGQEAAHRPNLFGIAVDVSIYNLMQRDVERELLPTCSEYDIGVMPYNPLNSGLLAGVLAKAETAARTASSRATAGLELHRARIEQFENLCHDLNLAPAVVGQAWLLHQPGITAPIIGARTLHHLAAGLAAATLDLPAGVLATLNEIFPGPGPDPESYAW